MDGSHDHPDPAAGAGFPRMEPELMSRMDARGATWSINKAERGEFAEQLAMEMLAQSGCSFSKSKSEADKDLHIDLYYNTPAGIKSADIKSIKAMNDRLIFVELLNSYGFKGWLYGSADHIWFERFESFYLVKRSTLCRWIEDHLKGLDPEPARVPSSWRFYQRSITHKSGKKTRDKTLVVPVYELEQMAYIAEKNEDQIKRTHEFYQLQRAGQTARKAA